MADRPPPRGRARGRARRDPGMPSQAPPRLGVGSRPEHMQIPGGTQPTWTSMGGRVKQKSQGDAPQPKDEVTAVTSAVGRGGVRNRRIIEQNTLITKPKDLVSKQGKQGNPVRLCANYFQMLSVTSWCLHKYRVDFNPDEDFTTKERRDMMRTGVKSFLTGYLFDGTLLYSPRRLDPDPLQLTVNSPREDATPIHITVRHVGDVSQEDYHYLQVFNIIMRKCMRFLNLQLLGRNFFDPQAKFVVEQHNLELWPGYVMSIRQHENSIMMCTEITHKVLRTDTVLQLLEECYRESRSDAKKLFMNRILGCVVLTDYNNRTYSIDDVDWQVNPNGTFQKKDGSEISYVQYFRERYSRNIRDTSQPMLVSNAKKREIRAGMSEKVYLVPELCRMTGLTEGQRANFHLMRDLASYTRVGPASRVDKLIKFCRRLQSSKEVMSELKEWDFKMAENVVNFIGRELPQEDIFGGAERPYKSGQNTDWTRDLRSNPMFSVPKVGGWVIMVPARFINQARSFLKILDRAANGMRWNLPQPKIMDIPDDRAGTYMSGLDRAMSGRPELIMCIVSNNNSDRYTAIKKKCYVDNGVPCQVVVARNLDSKGTMSIATKIAIQLNCKLGGAPWCLKIPVSNLMIVGYDACHDSHNKTKSYGALVASLNKQATHYYSSVTPHSDGQEMSRNIGLSIVKACKAYMEVNGSLPQKILLYRDGVGEGQIPYIVEQELASIRTILQDNLYPNNSLKLCFIIVSKRINTRIFGKRGPEFCNPQPGTVVDDCITLPERYDFFLVSQCVNQGTVSPTNYNIIYDNMGLSADHLQWLTYKLTHMYYNWSGTVRVPAPCQYAHKLAFLVSQYLRREPHPELERSLYYL